MRILGLLIALMGIAASVFGGWLMVRQDSHIRNAVRVPAMVVTSTVREYNGNKGRRKHKPEVVFAYQHLGANYTSKRLNAANQTPQGKSTAGNIVAKYPAGSAIEVWVPASSPELGYIEKLHHPLPYVLFGIGVSVLALGVGMLILGDGGRMKEPEAVAGAQPALFLLRTANTLGKRWMTMLVGGCVWMLLMVVPGVHYVVNVWNSAKGVDPVFWIFMAICVVCAGIAIGRGVWVLLIDRSFDEPRVMVNQAELRAGKAVLVVVEQPARSGVQLESLDVSVECVHSYVTGTGKNRTVTKQTVWSEVRSALANAATESAGPSGSQIVRGAVNIDLPQDARETSEKGEMPRYDWQISLRAHARGPDYRATYPMVLAK